MYALSVRSQTRLVKEKVSKLVDKIISLIWSQTVNDRFFIKVVTYFFTFCVNLGNPVCF